MNLCYFGLRLKEIRQHRNITQKELSSKLNISRQAYSNYEQGRCVPPSEILAQLSIILNYNFFIPFIQAFNSDKNESTHSLVFPNETNHSEYEQLISLYSKLPLDARENILELMRMISKENNNYEH